MAAATTAFLALERLHASLRRRRMYRGLRQWLLEDAPSHGVEAMFDAGDHDAAGRDQAQQHAARWIETPSDRLWTITDIAEAARIATLPERWWWIRGAYAVQHLGVTLGADMVLHQRPHT